MNIDDIARLVSEFENKFEGVYIIDPEALKKVKAAHSVMTELVKKFGGRINTVSVDPKEIHARFCVTLNYLDVIAQEKQKLMKVLSWSPVLAIEPISKTTFTFEFNIPYLWKRFVEEEPAN